MYVLRELLRKRSRWSSVKSLWLLTGDLHPSRSCLSAWLAIFNEGILNIYCLYISCHILLIKKCFVLGLRTEIFGKREDGRCCGSASSSGALKFPDFMNNHSASCLIHLSRNTGTKILCYVYMPYKWYWCLKVAVDFCGSWSWEGCPRSCQRSNKASV